MPLPAPLQVLGLAEGMLHPGSITSSAWQGRGKRRREQSRGTMPASPCCHFPPPPGIPPLTPCSLPKSQRLHAPLQPRGWECGSNCAWQGSNSESKTVVWLVSHPGPAALLFAFACLNPFPPQSPAAPRPPTTWGHPQASGMTHSTP